MKEPGMNKSIIHKFVLLIAAICTTFSVSAYDFEVDGIYYDKISDTSVEVTHDGNLFDNNGAGYSGNVAIPETIEINGITYFVCGIGRDAFYDCAVLTSVAIPASVTSIGEGALSDCPGLTEIVINENNPNYASNDGVLFNKTYTELILCPGGKAGIYNIPEGVTSIDTFAFENCTCLTSVSIPASVTSIGDGAFSGCISLTSVNIPASVTSIGDGVFSGCTGMTSVNIPEGIISIDNYAFYGCSSLTSVTIPASVTSIGEGAFSGCSGLTSVTIPASVTSIGEGAFSGCSGLTSVTIPASVTSIGEGAFMECTGLASVSIPASVTSIGEDAFRGCTSLISVTIPEGVISIGDGAFMDCTSLTSVTIPEGVTSIGKNSFDGCISLTSVTIPASVTSISKGAFYGCSGLTSVTIPEGVASIGEDAFWGCSGLTSVTIPTSVTSIGARAFSVCTGLTSVIIPEGVTSIDDYAFYYCRELNRVICFAETVPTFGYEVFAEVPTACTVYVPSGTRGSYASADELASYTIKEFGLTATPAEVTLEIGATAELTVSYTVDGAAETETEISSVLGREFSWSSSAENVAIVSTSGQVRAQNAGTAEIKVITRFGNTVFATSTVNVGTSGILDISADGIKISATSGKIRVENIGENQKVSAYTIDGICHIFQDSNDGTVEIPAETGKIYIIVVDGFATKVLAK